MNNFYDLSKPSSFIKLSKQLNFWLFYIIIIFLIVGFCSSIFLAPMDSQQGENYKIIYVHVPSAWICIWMYIGLTFFSILYLIKKHPFLDLLNQAFANIGFIFTILTLISGSLWGTPMWGTFWVWDARLTSVLVLSFIYLGYIILRNIYKDVAKGSQISSILAIVGFINIPIIKFSVEWWNTLHQPASITKFNTTIHESMLLPLIFITISFMLFSIYLLVINLRILIIKHKLKQIKIAQYEKFLLEKF
uniref:ABC transporter subunit C n=1 Tax=Palpitomonas bilix TaxID=652834 RepID=A0A1E1GHR2_9EUKA|nr:ABC transporter subunit C [Palpitomonas bilix]YP_009317256.1 ABC transporter subunit C [Palpitomonas bilix]BAV82397.1 ABC transporter subunit C [Palpitomonas bilix]BAV82424.1 ABC transporter subunit C [Palpitomonas bilix]